MSASQPLSGVKITLEGSKLTSATTDGGGYYAFSDLRAGGTYIITPRASVNFKPSRRSLNNLQRDESADFFGEREATPTPTPTPTPTLTATPTPTPKQECSEADQFNTLQTLRNFEPRWRSQIQGERAKIIAESVPNNFEYAEAQAVLGEIEFQYSFPKPCKAAVVTARYTWQVSYLVPGVPRKSKSVPRQRTISCGKLFGMWGCH
jgi:hypothetical protein